MSLTFEVAPGIESISIRSNLSSFKTFRLARPAIVVIVMIKTEPNQILESMIVRIVVQMRNLPLTYIVSVIYRQQRRVEAIRTLFSSSVGRALRLGIEINLNSWQVYTQSTFGCIVCHFVACSNARATRSGEASSYKPPVNMIARGRLLMNPQGTHTAG
jgi:hypothetical protein